uniref:Uncharacterized protein n=1 Tax=Amphimedon queenslandica TaxID=400682 RepID=A0A1X7V5I2_AMPQE
MGGTSSTEIVYRLEPLITTGAKAQFKSTESAVIVRYDGSTNNRDAIIENIEKLFLDNPCKEELLKTATNILQAVKNAKQVRDLNKWEKNRNLYKSKGKGVWNGASI